MAEYLDVSNAPLLPLSLCEAEQLGAVTVQHLLLLLPCHYLHFVWQGHHRLGKEMHSEG